MPPYEELDPRVQGHGQRTEYYVQKKWNAEIGVEQSEHFKLNAKTIQKLESTEYRWKYSGEGNGRREDQGDVKSSHRGLVTRMDKQRTATNCADTKLDSPLTYIK